SRRARRDPPPSKDVRRPQGSPASSAIRPYSLAVVPEPEGASQCALSAHSTAREVRPRRGVILSATHLCSEHLYSGGTRTRTACAFGFWIIKGEIYGSPPVAPPDPPRHPPGILSTPRG